MQAVLVIILAVFVTEASSDHITRVERTVAHLDNVVVLRHKREQTGSRDCFEKCEKSLEESVRNKGLYVNNAGSNRILKDKADFEVECKAWVSKFKTRNKIMDPANGSEFKKSKSCFAKCDGFSAILEVNKVLCEQKKNEFTEHLPCFLRFKTQEISQEAFKKACDGKCASEEMAVKNISHSKVKALSDIIQAMCKFVDCEVNCTNEVVIQQCPEDPKFGALWRPVGRLLIQKASIDEIKKTNAFLGTSLASECFKTVSPANGR